ncbi:MAG: 6-carboxytetrahydropterin synthase [Clostridium sp.]|jgi:6-pyruvoyltetrahydropterin/6-carboxytetrahydropterin synthase|nr:6-carboxytetrahydropterin synthase [Clostridium sp.]
MVSFTRIGLEYAHRFLDYEGEAQYLHGHHGELMIEVEGDVKEENGFVYPCNGIQHLAWNYLRNFDHALILQEKDPLLPEILKVYERQGIKDGDKDNRSIGLPIDNEFAKAYPESRLVVVKKVATCENLIEVFHSLLKDKLNIKAMRFTSGVNGAYAEFQ